jgi:glycosyltransferase involved in cell wall biosynthesis
VRISLVDPGSSLPWYDHELARALAKQRAEVTVISSRFKFAAMPKPDGYRRRELFYPATYRVFKRSKYQKPFKAAEHLAGLQALRCVPRDVLHVQWSWWPEVDGRGLPLGRQPSVLTAHDILPARGRLVEKPGTWRDFVRRFDQVVVHSEHGRRRLVSEVGVDEQRIQVIPHPVYRREPRYESVQPSLLAFGVLQRYKQVEHSIAVAQQVGCPLTVMGDSTYKLGSLLTAPGVTWRLGYATEAELDEALASATVALFPYRQELDQSGALHRALGAGVPVVVYDVGGLGEPVRRFGAGAVVPADDRDAMAAAVTRLLADAEAIDEARAGARRAAAELSWESAAALHLQMYKKLLDTHG